MPSGIVEKPSRVAALPFEKRSYMLALDRVHGPRQDPERPAQAAARDAMHTVVERCSPVRA
jgi:hypothetical protein